MAELVNDQQVICRKINKVGHGYWQGSCVIDGADVVGHMIKAGWARTTEKTRDDYLALERESKESVNGIWKIVD